MPYHAYKYEFLLPLPLGKLASDEASPEFLYSDGGRCQTNLQVGLHRLHRLLLLALLLGVPDVSHQLGSQPALSSSLVDL